MSCTEFKVPFTVLPISITNLVGKMLNAVLLTRLLLSVGLLLKVLCTKALQEFRKLSIFFLEFLVKAS